MTLQLLTKRYIPSPEPNTKPELYTMKVLSSLASMKRRHADCQIVKRKGTLYVICKSNPTDLKKTAARRVPVFFW